MKRNIIFIITGACSVFSLFAQTNSIDNPALKLDLPLFDFPYQIDAAHTLEYGFFESYTHPSMDASLNITANVYSAFHYGMNRFKTAVGADKFWKKFVYYGGTMVGDFFIYILPIPTSYVWMHESFHRAGFTHAGLQSHINYDFPTGAYTIADSGNFAYWYDIPRTIEAGIESEYLLVEKLQRNNFFYEQNMFNEFLYLLANYQAWVYAYMPFLNDDITMNVEGQEEEVSTDSLQWVYGLFHPGEFIPDERAIRMSDLKDNEKAFFKNRVMWSLINLASPMMFGIRSIPLGRDTGFYGNFALRHWYTSFGTDLSVDVYLKKAPYNLIFKLHNYLNYEHYYPAIEAALLDYPVNFNGLALYLSPRVMIGMQPKDQNFFTASPEFFGLAGLRIDFAVSKHFLPYLEVTAKTDGWVAGNEFLEGNVSVKLGISARF